MLPSKNCTLDCCRLLSQAHYPITVSVMMQDDEQLAALVLLLRLPTNQDGTQNDGASELQIALEQNDSSLMCFIGRLVNSYASTRSNSNGSNDNAMKYVLLRLAARVILMRYAPFVSDKNGVYDLLDERIFEWEKCLLKSLLGAVTVNTTMCYEIQSVDVEIAWSILGLLIRWSMQTQSESTNIVIRDLWVESMTALLARHRGCSLGPKNSTVPLVDSSTSASVASRDEQLMIQTITCLLDSSDETGANWKHEFNTAVASCVRSFPTTNNTTWTESILLGMIDWSGEGDAISLDVYGVVLQYLNMCLNRAQGAENTQVNQILYQEKVEKFQIYFFSDTNTSSEIGDPFVAIKSFLFFGLIVLCNESRAGRHDEDISLSDQMQHINRGEIYSSFLGFWQLLGPEWLYESPTTTSATLESASSSSDWWQRSDFMQRDNNNRLGHTWQLCTLIRLAAGEFRLSMGRWMAIIEDKRSSNNKIMSEIVSCARIVIQAVQLMTSLADIEDEHNMQSEGQRIVWNPDAILHTRQSLQDALNAAIQYFNEIEYSQSEPSDIPGQKLHMQWKTIGRMCCMIMGIIAPELELDELLNGHDKEKSTSSSFVDALCTCILFCDSVATKDTHGSKHMRNEFEHDEPLSCILSSVMFILDIASSDHDEVVGIQERAQQVLITLCNDGELARVMSSFLDRLHVHYEVYSEEVIHQASILSIAKLASIIVIGLLELSSDDKSVSILDFSKAESDRLSTSLMKSQKLFVRAK